MTYGATQLMLLAEWRALASMEKFRFDIYIILNLWNTCVHYIGLSTYTVNHNYIYIAVIVTQVLMAICCNYRLHKKHRLFLQQEGLHLHTEDKWQLRVKEN